MFDFEKLDVYQHTKNQNVNVLKFLREADNIDHDIMLKWKNESINSVLNLAEGTGRIDQDDKKSYYIAARGNIFECVALIQIIFELKQISEKEYSDLYLRYEQISKMLLGLVRSNK